MSCVVHTIECAICSVASAVGCVVGKVAHGVQSVVQNAAKDPLGSLAKIGAAIFAPQLLPVVSLADTVANGGSLTQGLESAGASYVGGQVGSGIGGAVAQDSGSALAGNVVGGAASGATAGAIGSTLQGKDPIAAIETGALAGGLGGAANTATSGINSDINQSLASNTQSVTSAINDALGTNIGSPTVNLSGLIPTGQIANQLINGSQSGALPSVARSPTPSTVSNPQLAAAGVPWLQNASTGLSYNTSAYNPLSSNTGANQSEALLASQNANIAPIMAQLTPEMANLLAARGAQPATANPIMAASGGGISCCLNAFSCISRCGIKPLQASQIDTKVTKQKSPAVLGALHQVDPQIAPNWHYGASCWALGDPSAVTPAMFATSTLAHGGLPHKYKSAAPEGHKPEFITGLTGYYAHGNGTGQSDDIPAMLHDGDYVIDADAVAALGDGSSKAGALSLDNLRQQVPHHHSGGGKAVPAQIADGEYVFPAEFVTALGGGDNKRGADMLDKMREELRKHKRSAPNSKIPPKAHQPIDYLKGYKG